jgi:chromate transporter
MHAELVERKKWIREERFLHALNFCMLLPGPEATQLATYCGWLLHGIRGGLVAGVLFVLPSAVLLWGLSWVYVTHGTVPWVEAIFHGLKPAVTAIVAAAVIRIGQRALRGRAAWVIAAVAFVAIFFLRVPFPAIIAGAALAGFVGSRWSPMSPSGSAELASEIVPSPMGTSGSTWQRAAKVIAISLALWWAPVLAAGLWQGWDGVLVREGVFFSKAALVTFGGAYAVLPYVGQQAVEVHGWLNAAQMMDGLGLAETTPGPLIMVVQFVGFLGGWNQPGGHSPLLMATLGAAITTWTTFVPSFLWIFLGAPHLERWRANVRLSGALAAVTAAVVGVVLNLAVWFGLQVFFPRGVGAGSVDGFAVVVGVLAFVALQRFKVGVVTVVLASGALGWAWSLVST